MEHGDRSIPGSCMDQFCPPVWNQFGTPMCPDKGHSASTPPTLPMPPLTMRQGDAGSIKDGLGQAVIVGLHGIGSCLQSIPDLLAALKGRCCVPKLIPLAAQLPVCHRIVALPLGTLLLQGLIATCSGVGCSAKEQSPWALSSPSPQVPGDPLQHALQCLRDHPAQHSPQCFWGQHS